VDAFADEIDAVGVPGVGIERRPAPIVEDKVSTQVSVFIS
jgi:hypothetical protein